MKPEQDQQSKEAGFCNCAETLLENFLTGEKTRVPSPPHHSCDYISRINKLVSGASINASIIAQRCHPGDSKDAVEHRRIKYTSEFSREMDLHRAKVLSEIAAQGPESGRAAGSAAT